MGECFPTTMQFFYDGTNELPLQRIYVDSNFRRLVYNGRKVFARVCESVCFENRHGERSPRTFQRGSDFPTCSCGQTKFVDGISKRIPNSLSLARPPALRTPSLTSLRQISLPYRRSARLAGFVTNGDAPAVLLDTLGICRSLRSLDRYCSYIGL